MAPPPFRSDKVVLYAATDGYVYVRSSDGTFQLARQSEVTTALTAGLATKAALVHTHIIADTTGLQAALDAKEAVDAQRVQLGTLTATTSGTSVTITGLPAGTRRIVVSLSGVSGNGTSNLILQLGISSGVETSGYLSATAIVNGVSTNTANGTTGFVLDSSNAAASLHHGHVELVLMDSATNLWACSGTISLSNAATAFFVSGTKPLAGALDRVRLTAANGTDAFDAGSINIAYER